MTVYIIIGLFIATLSDIAYGPKESRVKEFIANIFLWGYRDYSYFNDNYDNTDDWNEYY